MNDKFCDLSYSRIRISRGLDAHSKNWSGNWEQSWSRMMSVPYILMTKVISRWWRWFRHLPLLGNTELQNLENAYTWDLENYSIHLPILQHPKPNFVRKKFYLFAISKSSVLAQWTREIWKKTICSFTLNQKYNKTLERDRLSPARFEHL